MGLCLPIWCVFNGQGGLNRLASVMTDQCASSRRFLFLSFRFLRGLFPRLLCLRCALIRALNRARREGAVGHRMDDPLPQMARREASRA